MYFYVNPRKQVMILQMVVVFMLIVIGAMIYSSYQQSEQIESDIQNLDLTCPEPSCPEPSCPQCPNLQNPITSKDLQDVKDVKPVCPTTDEIVRAIFPGRNTGITQAGRYFDIKTYHDYTIFPLKDDILDPPLRSANVDVALNEINNSIDNNNIDTNSDASVRRMSMGSDMKAVRTDPKTIQTVLPSPPPPPPLSSSSS